MISYQGRCASQPLPVSHLFLFNCTSSLLPSHFTFNTVVPTPHTFSLVVSPWTSVIGPVHYRTRRKTHPHNLVSSGIYDTACFWQGNALTQKSRSPDHPTA